MQCERLETCKEAGSDCPQEGGESREFDCFGPITSFTAGDETNEVNGLADHSNSIPETTEAVSAGNTSKPFTRKLPVKLSQEELSENGEEMSRLISIWTKAKLDKKAYDKAAKSLIDTTEKKYVEIAEIVQAGCEQRDVQCYAEFDVPHGVKRIIRCDTYEEVETVTLTAEELQTDFNFAAEQSVSNVRDLFSPKEDDDKEWPDPPEIAEQEDAL